MFTKSNLQQFLSGFDENKRETLTGVYITSLQQHRQTCEQAAANEDANALQASVHDVKSLCYMLGAQDEGALAEAIETALKTGGAQDAYTDVLRLLAGIDHVLGVLKG